MGRRTTGRRTEALTLSRTQTRILADKLDPLMVHYPSREKAAQGMGVKEHVLQSVCSRGASIRLPKEDFEKLVNLLGVDVSKWDLARY